MNRPNMDAYWMPFTANRQFKRAPRLLVSADGMYYTDADGRQVLDGAAGLWCVNAGHNRRPIVEAIQRQAGALDYAPPFQMGHPLAFEAAEQLVAMAPNGLTQAFFVNSGSEAVETALKMALAYHRVRGDAARVKLIGRERGYHGVNFGGVAVGGMAGNRKHFPVTLPMVDHLRHPLDIAKNAFSRGEPAHGAELAEELESRILTLHDPSTIAAVIVEPMQGSTGVILPPKGYLQRLRQICDKYGILLIFDEVITGFGRLGADWASNKFGVLPDLLTCAKGLTNGSVPMGAVLARSAIYQAFMDSAPEQAIEFPHGYTYSAHPLACAAAIATLGVYRDDGLFQRAAEMAPHFEMAVHALQGKPHVKDIRNLGLVAGIELEARPGEPGKRGMEVFLKCWEQGVMVRVTGDTLAVSPPLIIEAEHIDRLFAVLGQAIEQTP
ncbi:aspartate aminotransferase family protein [Paludibacterium purpuratum]|uniref:Beta-alanine--pyruvate transaminase n=1 Tax=Paludibacterium purpuratum TaxID=1144873 RepID=A0A4V3DVA4_9NEIS|nr:aspartate aminotransferase family protein [Paludibacterium purpuratum]TDR80269.1 beta-alanine--pyruvate transaminase [Paludibacterium purpuratum]